MLSAIGRDCVGALQFLPEGTEPGPAGRIDARPASEADIEALLAGLARSPLGLAVDEVCCVCRKKTFARR